MQSKHAELLNELDYMASCPFYTIRRQVLRRAEALIYQQELRINELEKSHGTEQANIIPGFQPGL